LSIQIEFWGRRYIIIVHYNIITNLRINFSPTTIYSFVYTVSHIRCITSIPRGLYNDDNYKHNHFIILQYSMIQALVVYIFIRFLRRVLPVDLLWRRLCLCNIKSSFIELQYNVYSIHYTFIYIVGMIHIIIILFIFQYIRLECV